MQSQNVGAVQAAIDPLVVPGLIAGKTAKGRFIFNATGKAAIVQLHKNTGASIAQLSKANGINVNLIPKWSRSLIGHNKTKRNTVGREPKLIPIKIVRPQLTVSEYPIVIELSKGTIRVTLPRVQDLGAIIEQLNGAR
jgi:transposase-like protein